MDISDSIFSPGALQLLAANEGPLNAQALELIDSSSTSNTSYFDGIQRTASTAPQVPTTQYSAPSSQPTAASFYSTFSASTEQAPRRARKKFENPERRAEVAQVRKQGSCMRCHWNKIPVCQLPSNSFFLSMIAYSLWNLVLECTAVHVLYLLLGLVRCSIFERPMDGLRTLFLEDCQYLRAWYCET